MTRQQAMAKLRKLYGEQGFAQIGDRVSSPDDREKNLAILRAARAAKTAIDAEIDTWLKAQPEYQALLARRRAAVVKAQQCHVMPYYKFTIGKDKGWCREILAHGDTWEQAFAEAEQKTTGNPADRKEA